MRTVQRRAVQCECVQSAADRRRHERAARSRHGSLCVTAALHSSNGARDAVEWSKGSRPTVTRATASLRLATSAPRAARPEPPSLRRSGRGRNRHLSTMSAVPDSLELRTESTRGRGLFARTAIAPGGEVLRSPLHAHALSTRLLSAFCGQCLAPASLQADALQRCSACRVAHYCSERCARTAWTGGHKTECRALRACASAGPPDPALGVFVPDTPVRALARLLWAKSGREEAWVRSRPQEVVSDLAVVRGRADAVSCAAVARLVPISQID